MIEGMAFSGELKVDRNSFHDIAAHGIESSPFQEIQIYTNNEFYNIPAGLTVGAYGASLNAKGHVEIRGNYIHNCPVGINLNRRSRGNIISNNYLIDCGNSGLNIYGENSLYPDASSDMIISSNVFESYKISPIAGISFGNVNANDTFRTANIFVKSNVFQQSKQSKIEGFNTRIGSCLTFEGANFENIFVTNNDDLFPAITEFIHKEPSAAGYFPMLSGNTKSGWTLTPGIKSDMQQIGGYVGYGGIVQSDAPMTLSNNANSPSFTMNAPLAAANQRIWDQKLGSDGAMHFRIVDDAASGNDWMTVFRSSNTFASAQFPFGQVISGIGATSIQTFEKVVAASPLGTNAGVSARSGGTTISMYNGGTVPEINAYDYTNSLALPMIINSSGGLVTFGGNASGKQFVSSKGISNNPNNASMFAMTNSAGSRAAYIYYTTKLGIGFAIYDSATLNPVTRLYQEYNGNTNYPAAKDTSIMADSTLTPKGWVNSQITKNLIATLPSQTGNAGKFLFTNGAAASWQADSANTPIGGGLAYKNGILDALGGFALIIKNFAGNYYIPDSVKSIYLTSGVTATDTLFLPLPSANKNRIIYIHNSLPTGTVPVYTTGLPINGNGGYTFFTGSTSTTALAANKNVIIQCDGAGTKWYMIGNNTSP